MYVDIIHYQLADGISEDYLKSAASDILNLWMKKQPGFLRWDIGKTQDGFTDFVFWQSQQHADRATENMKEIPQTHNWMKCYDMSSVSSQKITNLVSFEN